MNKLRTLIDQLNIYRDAYYNKNTSLIDDKKYDDLYDELVALERLTGIIYPDSPSQTVGYIVQSKLAKVKHDHPMLSLDKTKDINVLYKFCNNKEIDLMLKMDGLSCTLHYDTNGDLVLAATRGSGIEGEDITENAKCVSNIPQHINNNGVPYIIDGEIIMTYTAFNTVNSKLSDEQKYSHPRNLAAGSIRQLDTKITADRNLKFIAWKVISGEASNSFYERLKRAEELGFTTVPVIKQIFNSVDDLNKSISTLKNDAELYDYPIDGMVAIFDDIKYGENLGLTAHHPRHSLAFKLYNESQETVLRNIEWNTTRTGMIAPTAVFDPIDLDGAITTRATLYNISIMKELELGIGDTISGIRANQVIPKIIDNLTRSNTFVIPDKCPCCGSKTIIKNDGTSEFLYCSNENCGARILSRFVHFVSKSGANIEGLSEATLNTFIENNLISTFKDLYHLDLVKDKIISLNGFGERSYNKLIKAINNSRNIKLEHFIYALGINNIGIQSAKEISETFDSDFNKFYAAIPTFDFTTINDFGETLNNSIKEWYNNRTNTSIDFAIENEFNFVKTEKPTITNTNNNFISGKVFVVTGTFNTMKRSELERLITDAGGKLTGSVSKKTDYLLTNETTGTKKYTTALELCIPVMSEKEFLANYTAT